MIILRRYMFLLFIFVYSSVSSQDNLAFVDDVTNLVSASCRCTFNLSLYVNKDSKSSYLVVDNTLHISAPSVQDASILAYTYLDDLGFRFYGPEDHWTYIPKLTQDDLIIKREEMVIPFVMNSVFASYGMGPKKNEKLKAPRELWDRWRQRLRLTDRQNLRFGHYGSKFNKKYKKLIQSKSTWRKNSASESSSNLKLCFDNPDVINLYKTDAEERLYNLIQTKEPPYYINLEPSDGGGHCYDNSQDISNSIFTMVNSVSAHLKKIHPNAWVTLYSYHQHALIPQFKLNDNVLVGIVPDAYQLEYTPSDMKNAWDKFHNHKYLRSYLNLPIWNFELSREWESSTYHREINRLKDKKYFGYRFEVSPSFFVEGWNLYSISQTTYDDFKEHDEYDTFLNRMFNSKELIVLFELLISEDKEIYYADLIKKLRNHSKTTEDDRLKKRIVDMISYAEYKLAYYYYSNDQSKVNLDNLLNAIYSDAEKLNIHSYGVHRAIFKKTKRKFDVDSKLRKTTKVKDKLQRRVSYINFEKVQWEPQFPNWVSSQDHNQTIKVRKSFSSKIYAKAKTKLIVKIKAEKFKEKARGEIVLRSKNGEEYRQKLVYDAGFQDYIFDLKEQGVYDLKLLNIKGDAEIILPSLPIAIDQKMKGKWNAKRQNYYFHSSRDEIVLELPKKIGKFTLVSYPDMKPVYEINNTACKKHVIVKLPREGIYLLKSHRNSFKLINQPHYISLSPNAVWGAKIIR